MKTSTLFAVTLATLAQIPATFAAPEASRLPLDVPSKILPRDNPTSVPSVAPKFDALTSQGCYLYAGSNYTKLSESDIKTYEISTGGCGKVCKDKKYDVMALYGGACFCGDYYPPEGSKVKDGKCDFPCPAYPKEACGSLGTPKYWNIFNTGREINVEPMPKEEKDDDKDRDDDKDKDDKKSSTTSSSSSAPTSDATAPAATETNSDDGDNEEKDEKKTNVAGIAAGVVVGVAVIAGAIGGFFFWMRRRRNSELEEDHRRNAAVNAFINGSKPPSSHGSISMTDSRMDPVLANRRLSDGSIADNQDYSRRILRVTNA